MNVWRLITHHEDKDAALFWTRQNSRIASGWGAIGDIRDRGYGSVADITSAIRTEYPALDNSHLGGAGLWDFYAQIQNGDLVILSANKPRVLVVEVEGDYEWTEESPSRGSRSCVAIDSLNDFNCQGHAAAEGEFIQVDS